MKQEVSNLLDNPIENTISMEELRVEIDDIDNELLQLLGKRMRCAQRIGAYKKQRHLPVVQMARWQEILNAAIQKGQALDLSADFVTQFLTAIHDESVRHQTLVVNG